MAMSPGLKALRLGLFAALIVYAVLAARIAQFQMKYRDAGWLLGSSRTRSNDLDNII
jgi:hypothetical protein